MKLLSVSFGLTVGVLGLLQIYSPAQWGPGACGPVGPILSISSPVSSLREWRELPEDPGRVHLFVNGIQIGGYCPIQKVYRTLDPKTKEWNPPSPPPSDLPSKYLRCGCSPDCLCTSCDCQKTGKKCQPGCSCETVTDLPKWMTNGVDPNQCSGGKCEINGKPVTVPQARQAIIESKVPDDGDLLRITVIGPKELRDRVALDFETHPSLAWFRGRVNLKGFSPDNWHVNKYGFKTDGQPTIYVQSSDPSGKVLHRQDDYRDGPEGLSEALRKVHPDYKSEKDPDRRKSDVLPFQLPDWLKGLDSQTLILGGLVLLMFFLLRK